MKPRFAPDSEAGDVREAQRIIDPEADDASEPRFAISLEQPARPTARFVVDRVADQAAQAALESKPRIGSHDSAADVQKNQILTDKQPPSDRVAITPHDFKPDIETDPGAWRQEVAARLNKYRERRRPRAPRYPSLRLKFETVPGEPPVNTSIDATRGSRQATAEDAHALAIAPTAKFYPVAESLPAKPIAPETTARIIEFPRSSASPRPLDELAEPVLDRPRILEAPEIIPAPPALGGILIEAAEQEPNDRRPGFEMPLQPARMMRRLGASAMDVLIVASALSGFGYLFFRIDSLVPAPSQAAKWGLILAAVLWACYQYLFLVHCGTTLGLRLMKLRLSRFDGKPVPRHIRRWRVLASVLSGLSLGLGYAWCMLDEDELCWHDRITHTYMAPRESGT
jgi:uncharacterized RDD family membrane protein YckC